MKPLTARQRSVYEALVDRDATGLAPPTLDQLCDMLGLRSRGSLHKHVQALVEAGLVRPMAGLKRGVCLTKAESRPETRDDARADGTVPMLGRIAAGEPLEAIEDAQRIEVPQCLRRGPECFALEVAGDSMSDEGILDGDTVVIAAQQRARNGDIVVALVDGSEATLKRIQFSHDMIQLIPANANYDTLILSPDRVAIQGVLVGQMRQY